MRTIVAVPDLKMGLAHTEAAMYHKHLMWSIDPKELLIACFIQLQTATTSRTAATMTLRHS